ncbi:hypothetical protein V1478_014230 [Vespula squamosa]|uniref:Uncharacterized protein n=1 Tax=Vespula squamosa TaxID=30214 RepID=A0ABD2A7G9_VESSQ
MMVIIAFLDADGGGSGDGDDGGGGSGRGGGGRGPAGFSSLRKISSRISHGLITECDFTGECENSFFPNSRENGGAGAER